MKIAGLTIAYNEEKLITGCIKSLEPFVDTHLVVISEKPYYGEPEPMDNTAEIAEELGAEVFTGFWKDEHDQRNVGVKMLSEYDWLILTDVDMWFTKHDMQKIVDSLEHADCDALIIPQTAYWKDIDHVLINDMFMPIVAIKPNVRFTHIGCVDVVPKVVNSICHHINWCEPKDILKKVLTYSHAPEFNNAEEWYNREFKDWKDKDYCIMPDGVKFGVKQQSLPKELRDYLVI